MTITVYDGTGYQAGKNRSIRTDWIRIEWGKGFLDMKKYYWDRLSQKKRNLILNAEK